MQFIIETFNHYGYIVLLVALMLELIAVPLPGEALMTYCGYVIYTGKMNWVISVIAAAIGTIIGITISFFIGKSLGIGFFEKYGHYIHMNKQRLDKISNWFQKYGNKLLIVAYFIPGVRHITGYFSGITNVSYKKFAINAYLGAILWTTTFITLGKVLGPNWERYHLLLKKYLLIGSLIIAVMIMLIYIYKSHKQIVYEFVLKMLNNSLTIFHSFGKVKALIGTVVAVFLVFSTLVMGIIQDFLAQEFREFDELTRYIIVHVFDEDWGTAMRVFSNSANMYFLLFIILLTAIFIMIKGKNKLLELRFLTISFLGAVALSSMLRNIFHRIGPTGTEYTFPSAENIMAVVTYGFLTYLVIRYNRKLWINSLIISLYLVMCLLPGLSIIYFNIQYPSDVAAGYEFGFVWLSLSIIMLEVYRVLPKLR